jgi:hypothetical protein
MPDRGSLDRGSLGTCILGTSRGGGLGPRSLASGTYGTSARGPARLMLTAARPRCRRRRQRDSAAPSLDMGPAPLGSGICERNGRDSDCGRTAGLTKAGCAYPGARAEACLAIGEASTRSCAGHSKSAQVTALLRTLGGTGQSRPVRTAGAQRCMPHQPWAATGRYRDRLSRV